MNYLNLVLALVPCVTFVIYLIAIRSRKLTYNPVEIPSFAKKVLKPDGQAYLNAWVDGGRVHVVFSNMPWAKVIFDHRVSGEFGKVLQEI